MTDHRVLKFSLQICDLKRGQDFWKLNTSLLECEEYKNGIHSIVENLEHREDSRVSWEIFKHKVKEFSIAFAKAKQRNDKEKVVYIEKELQRIEDEPAEQFNTNKKRELEIELDRIYNEKAKGAQIRSKSKWIIDGEKNTKYFLGLENAHQSHNVIRELKCENDILIRNQSKILGKMCRFYEALYSSNMKEDIDIDNYLLNSHVPKITQDDKDFCNSFPSMEECTDAVRNMKLNKSPGLDGLPSEFYKSFWDKIKHLFYDNLNSILENDEMSYTQRLSIITLIHKKGDKNLLKNYRPISLTNTDYKIIAFVFARRLQKILNNYIGEEQSAYIKGRFIGENAKLILDIFDYCENENKDGILLFLDFEKSNGNFYLKH